jgi:glycolate oxidase
MKSYAGKGMLKKGLKKGTPAKMKAAAPNRKTTASPARKVSLKSLARKLEVVVGKDFVITPEKVEYWSYTFGDATMYRSSPDVIVYPGKIEEVQSIVRLAAKGHVPVVPGGGLTGLSGGAVCIGGILLNLSRLRSILQIDPISHTVVVQPGVSCAVLNTALAEQGMVIPVAPASHAISTIGANIAEASGGTWGMSKGTFKNYLLALKVVDGEGNLFVTGYPFPKSSTGPDLTSLMIGSEGTLGIIVELTFRCDFIPEDTWTIRCSFGNESVLQEIHEAVARERINLYSFEYMDPKMMACFGKSNMLLLLQTAGSAHDARKEADRLVAILERLNPLELKYTNDPKESEDLYAERRSCLGAMAKFDREKPVIVQFDPVLPLRKFALGVRKMRELADREGLLLIIYGHAGDGNLHPSLVVHDTIEDKRKAARLVREFDTWVEAEGGCYSGEHAVGFFLGRSREKLSPTTAGYVKSIKKAFDPKGILNPGKVVNVKAPGMEVDPVLSEFVEIGKLCSLCTKCHLCKNDSPKFKDLPLEHNSIRGRVALVDAAARGKVLFSTIRPFIEEMEPWTVSMNCPTYMKTDIGKLIDLSLKAAEVANPS